MRTLPAIALCLIVVAACSTASNAPAGATEPSSPSSAVQALRDLDLIHDPQARSLEAGGSTVSLTTGLNVQSASSGVLAIRPREASGPEMMSGALVYPGRSSQIVVTDSTIGASAAYAVLADADAATDYSYEISVGGAPASLTVTDSGGVAVRDAAGVLVNTITPAWAVDAAGRSLPSAYSVSGGVLTQHVDHRGAVYPVVADPRVSCDLIWCTTVLNKTQTKTASQTLAAAGALLCGPMTAALPPLGAVCGAYAAAFFVAAVQAHNSGKCVGVRRLVIGGSVHPVIEKC
jgi:hypothetical protein